MSDITLHNRACVRDIQPVSVGTQVKVTQLGLYKVSVLLGQPRRIAVFNERQVFHQSPLVTHEGEVS